MGFLSGKRALIVGVASERSIAWGIAEAMHREAPRLPTPTRTKNSCRASRRSHSKPLEDRAAMRCVQRRADPVRFRWHRQTLDSLDIIVHAVAYARARSWPDRSLSLRRATVSACHEISSYSFVALAKAGMPLMKGRQGALLTLTYIVPTAPSRITT